MVDYNIAAIDPGLTTGIAYRFSHGEWGTVSVPRSMKEVVLVQLESYQPKIIIIETFIGMGYLSKYGIETMELVGAIKFWCIWREAELVRRTNVQRRPLIPVAKDMLLERKKKLGASFSFTDHEMDALSHLLSWERDVERGRTRAKSNFERDKV